MGLQETPLADPVQAEDLSPLYAELALYHRDRNAWYALSVPRIARQMDGRSLDQNLAQFMRLPRELQKLVWLHLDPSLRTQLRPGLLAARDAERVAQT